MYKAHQNELLLNIQRLFARHDRSSTQEVKIIGGMCLWSKTLELIECLLPIYICIIVLKHSIVSIY